MKSNDKLLKEFLKDKKRSESDLAYQWKEATINQAFYAGDKMYYDTSINDNGRKRMVVFNRVKPFVSAVAGFMIQTRRKPNYQAVLQSSEEQQLRSEYLNALSDQYRSNANADQVETQQDIDMLIAGYGAVDSNQDYEKNPDGEILMERIAPLDVGWDGMARQPNLLDARFVWRRKSYLKEEAIELFGGDDEDYSQTVQQSDPQYDPRGGQINSFSYDLTEPNPDMVDVYYYQWWERKAYYRAENPLSQLNADPELQQRIYQAMEAMVEFRSEDDSYEGDVDDLFEFDPSAPYLTVDSTVKKDITALFAKLNIDIEWVKRFRKCYYTAICSNKKVFKQFKSLDQNGFTIKFKTGDYDERNRCWFGMVTQLREPAKYANKALTEILYVIASNSKGGVMYETTAVKNPAKFEKMYATTRAAIEVNDGAISGNKIAPKAQAALPTGYEQVLAEAKDGMFGSTGVNPEYLGSSENKQVSALLESQRIKQVVTTLASFFDAITLYQKEHARLMITLIRALAENSTGRLVKVLGQDGAVRFEQLMSDNLADEYEIDIGEAPETAAQKDETAKLMMDLTMGFAPLGINLMPVSAKYLPLKQADIRQLIEIASPKQPPPPDPMAMKAAELELAKKESEVQKNQASANDTNAAAALKQQELQNGGQDPLAGAELALRAEELNLERDDQKLRAADMALKANDSHAERGMRMAEMSMPRETQSMQLGGQVLPPLQQAPDMTMQMVAQSNQQIAQALSQMAQVMGMLGQVVAQSQAPKKIDIQYDANGDIVGAMQTMQ